ncbi:Speckle-type POZ protein [Hordeum vulgare]|nr:Speckle-type POZ protein [Hordeum vulgare]
MPQGKGLGFELEFMLDKGKEVLPPLEKGKEVVSPFVDMPVQDHPNVKGRNHEHYHEEAGPTHLCKLVFASKVEALPLPLDFMKHFPAVPTEFSLQTNNSCSWRVMVKVLNSMVTLDQGWATFPVVHHVRIGYMLTSKLLTPNTMKLIVLTDNDVEVVTKCKMHDEAFVCVNDMSFLIPCCGLFV